MRPVAIDNLQTGQDWCLFVDSTTMQNVASASVGSALSTVSLITSHTTSATLGSVGNRSPGQCRSRRKGNRTGCSMEAST